MEFRLVEPDGAREVHSACNAFRPIREFFICMSQAGSRSVIYAALAGNSAIAATKFAAAWWTGSSAMLSEAIHSLVDTSNQVLLLFGMRRAARPPDRKHPFGYGMEIYFWSFVVALMIFALGGAVSVYEGIHKLSATEPISDPWLNLLVLGVSFVFEGYSFRIAFREMRSRFPGLSPLGAIKASKDPSVFAVLLEDTAALAGLTIAAIGVSLAYLFGKTYFDGLASIAIGVVLVMAAGFLARETLSLLTGESASRDVLDNVRALVQSDERVQTVDELLSLHLGPREILLAISIDFRDSLSGAEIEEAARDLSDKLAKLHPAITRVYLRPVSRPDRAWQKPETPSPEAGHGQDEAGQKLPTFPASSTVARGPGT